MASLAAVAFALDLLLAPSADLGPGTEPSPTVSRCRGEECRGEALCLLSESPLPPREELRGETLPDCRRPC